MKKTMLIILSAVIAFGMLTAANWVEVHYTRHDCTVVSYVEDVVVVEDKTNFTDDYIYDDIVEGCKVK